MKTVSRMKRSVIALAVMLCFAVVSCGVLLGTVRASAVDAKTPVMSFSYGSIGRAYIKGVTSSDVRSAFEGACDRLTEAFEEEEIDCTLAPRNGNDDVIGQNWPDPTNVKGIAIGFAFCPLTHAHKLENTCWGAAVAVVFNPHTKEAYTLRGARVTVYVGNGGTAFKAYGYPKGEEFKVGGTVYQNFTFGYIANDTWHEGKKVDAEGAESDLTVNDIAESMTVNVWQDVATETFANLSVSDYENAYKAYYESKEINTNNMTLTGNSKALWRQDVTDASGHKTGEVVFNETRKEMFTVTNTFLSEYNSEFAAWGDPVGEEATYHGVVNQQFANGVAVVADGGEIEFHNAMKVDPETGDIVSVVGNDSVGAVVEGTVLPSGVTAQDVKAAVAEKYDAAMGVPNALMNFAQGSKTVLEQTFVVSGGNSTSKIFLDVSKTPLKAVLLDADTYELYNLPTRFNEGLQVYPVTGEMLLGPALSDAFTVDEKKYQNFLYGAIELTADKSNAVFPGVNYSATGERTVLDLSDKITIDVNELFIPNSYNTDAATLYDKFVEAYKALVANGVAVGMPNKEGIGHWYPDTDADGGIKDGEFIEGRGMIKLGLHMTDSDTKCYYGVTAMLAYSPDDGKVYIMKDGVINNFASYYCVYGAPRGNLTATTLTVDGEDIEIEIQNFQLGYLVVMNGAASMTADKNWDFELRGAVNLDGSRIPGTVYPGDKGDNGNKGDGDTDPEAGCSCGSFITSVNVTFGSVAAVIILGSAVALVFVRRRKEN